MPTPDGVEALWHLFKETGDPAARDRLVVHYAPLVKYVAGRLRVGLPARVDQDDLISDGVIGLIGAIERFDVARGLQFATYAVPRIRGAMVDGLRALDWVPRQVREQTRDINTATTALEGRLQRRPSEAELADELGISGHELRRRYSQGSYATLLSLDSQPPHDDPATAVAGGVPGAPDGFAAAIHHLPERDQVVMALYYWEGLSLAEIGQVLGVSESRVSQLMTRATLELRRRLGG